jgi:PAS domain S-box-containing protein
MQFVPSEEQKVIETHMGSLNIDESIKKIECRVIQSDGTKCWLEWTDRAIFNENGDLTGFQSIGRDITEKKEMDEVIQQSSDRYQSLIELTPNGFFICEINSGDFLLINQKTCDLLGYTMPDLLTNSLWDLIDPDEKDGLQERIQTQRQEGVLKFPREVCTFLCKDKSTLTVELFSSLIIFEGALVLQGVIREMSD